MVTHAAGDGFCPFCEPKTCTLATRSAWASGHFRRKSRVAILLLVVGDLPMNQFSRQLRQSIKLILAPTVCDRYVLALDIAGLLQALAKSAQTVRSRLSRSVFEVPDHRQGCLLRARRERPCDCRAAEQRDERAAVRSITSSARNSSAGEIVISSVERSDAIYDRFGGVNGLPAGDAIKNLFAGITGAPRRVV
jgi:hypothetical protein